MNDVSFAHPQLLWLIALPLLLLGGEIVRRRRQAAVTRPKILAAEASASTLTLAGFATSVPKSRRHGPRIWLCVGLVLAVVALARPQWGRLEEPVFDQSREILLAVDLSRSMLTPDVKPTRLERSKLLIQALLEKLAGERVGMAVFSGTAFLQSPLSADYEILREFLPALGPDFLPQGGTNYRALLDTAIDAFNATSAADRFLVILSDGEATDDEWRSRLETLKTKGVRVIALGIGTEGGGMIPDGSGGFVKDERGAVVMSRLESNTLRELATATNGIYRDASTWLDLAALVRETVEAGRAGSFTERKTVRLVERFQWPLALAVWCLLVSFHYEFPVRPRVRDLKVGPAREKPAANVPPIIASALLIGLALLLPSRGLAASLAKSKSPASSAPAPTAAPAEENAVAKIVGRLANAPERTARDWADLGRETVIWGSRLKSGQQPVPEGPVNDALAATTLGAKLDPKATDWPKLREELEALLEKPEEKKQDDKSQDQKKDNQDKQDQDKQDQNQEQQQDPSKQDKSQQDSSQQKQQPQKSDQKQDQSSQEKQDDQRPQGEKAFGDMKDNPPPPPPPPSENQTQQVGGEKQERPPEEADPSLAPALQKLDQIRHQDSPAQLFQMMDGERKPLPPGKKGKDW